MYISRIMEHYKPLVGYISSAVCISVELLKHYKPLVWYILSAVCISVELLNIINLS